MPLLPSAGEFREIVSGRRLGLKASLFRAALALAEIPYTAAVRRRNERYDSGRAAIHRVSVPVISVGNLTLGGVGKTPMVEWLARWFQERGVRVALVSRGYGAKPGELNDEALELAQKLPGTPHVLDPDRFRGAQQAIREHGAELLLLDDGFQHRRLARDLDIVLVDALEPFGFGHVFPRGTLREPLTGWRRAQVIALSRADMVSADQRGEIRAVVHSFAPQAAWLEVTHRPRCLMSASGKTEPLTALAGRRVAAFCGIGNPPAFRHSLRSCGYEVLELREFPDHCAYEARDIEQLGAWAKQLDVAAIVCTQKDRVKINLEMLGDRPLWTLAIGLEVLAGEAELVAALEPILRKVKD